MLTSTPLSAGASAVLTPADERAIKEYSEKKQAKEKAKKEKEQEQKNEARE